MKHFLIGLCLSLALPNVGCVKKAGDKKTITVKGSDTMVILGQRWAEVYMKAKPEVTLQVTGGGSGTGIAALIDGSTDICEASRPMKDKEKDQLKSKHSRDAFEIPVAMDGLAIFVNEENPLSEITLEQLKAIYTATSKGWMEIGGADGKGSDTIVTYGRENNSGTYMYFKEHVLNDADFASSVQTLPGTAAVINAVSKDKSAIGYGGIGYAKGVKVLKVKKDASSPAVEATMENVVSGKYPISRFLYLYTVGAPQGAIKEYVEWVLGKEGQEICQKVGYYPLPEDKKPKLP